MTIQMVTEKVGARKREIVGYFVDREVANAVKNTFDADSDAQVTEIEAFEGTAEAWLSKRDQASRESVLSKLTDAERKILGL